MNSVDTHAQPIDPNISPAEDKPQLVQCQECRALLPLNHFGIAKHSRHGRTKSCLACKAQYLRMRRKAKGGKSAIDDDVLRCVSKQNRMVIATAIDLGSTCEMAAFDPVSKKDYKVFFGKSATLHMNAVCVFDTEGSMLRELAYSGQLHTVQKEILAFFKSLGLRLELSKLHAMAAKNVVYFV